MRSFRKITSAISQKAKKLIPKSWRKTPKRSLKKDDDLSFVEILGIIIFSLGLIVGLSGHIVDNYVSHLNNSVVVKNEGTIVSETQNGKQEPSFTNGIEKVLRFLNDNFSPLNLFLDFYSNISTDLILTAVTILIVDKAYEIRSEEQLLRQLKRQMASRYNQVALEAVKELTALKALYDERLNGIDLRHADLTSAPLEGGIIMNAELEDAILVNAKMSGVNFDNSNLNNAKLMGASLVGACLKNCRFYQTDLSGADLSWADLTGATFITEDQLMSSNSLWGATLQDCEKYDGKYDLKGDIEEAMKFGLNYDDPEDRTRFYSQDR